MSEHMSDDEDRMWGDPAARRSVADDLVQWGGMDRAVAERDAPHIVRGLRRLGWAPMLETERRIEARTAERRRREAIVHDALMQRWRDELATLRRDNERLRALLEVDA